MIKLISPMLAAVLLMAQPQPAGSPIPTTLCDILRQPQQFKGKLVSLRAVIEPGVEDLPEGAADQHCHAELKFFTPDDTHLSKLLKSKEFQKLVRALKKSPRVEATISGVFQVTDKPENRLAIESVSRVTAQPRPKPQRHPKETGT